MFSVSLSPFRAENSSWIPKICPHAFGLQLCTLHKTYVLRCTEMLVICLNAHNRTWFACSRSSAHEFVFSNNAISGVSSAQAGGLDHWPRSGSSNGIRRQRSPHTHMAVRERTRDNLRIYRAPKTHSGTRAHASARRHCE